MNSVFVQCLFCARSCDFGIDEKACRVSTAGLFVATMWRFCDQPSYRCASGASSFIEFFAFAPRTPAATDSAIRGLFTGNRKRGVDVKPVVGAIRNAPASA